MKNISNKEITASILRDGFSNNATEFIYNNFKIGFDGKLYFVGKLFTSQVYGYFDTIRELKFWLHANKL
jgi:hypothetical protein